MGVQACRLTDIAFLAQTPAYGKQYLTETFRLNGYPRPHAVSAISIASCTAVDPCGVVPDGLVGISRHRTLYVEIAG